MALTINTKSYKQYVTLSLILIVLGLLNISGCNNSGEKEKLIAYKSFPVVDTEIFKKIGSDGNYFFGRLRDLIIISDSVLIVSDLEKTTIEQFNLNGEYIATIATKGKGPGELPSSFFSILNVNNDSLIVRHNRSNRVDYFAIDEMGVYRYVKSWKQKKLNRRHISIFGSHTGHKFYAYSTTYNNDAQKYTFNSNSNIFRYHPVIEIDKFNNILKDSVHLLKIPNPMVEADGQNLRFLGMPPYQYQDRFLLTEDEGYLIARPDSSTFYFYNSRNELKKCVYLNVKKRPVEVNDLNYQFELMGVEGETRQKMKVKVPEIKPPFQNIWATRNYIFLHVDNTKKGKLIAMLTRNCKPVGKLWLSNKDKIEQIKNGKIFTIHKDNSTGNTIRIYRFKL